MRGICHLCFSRLLLLLSVILFKEAASDRNRSSFTFAYTKAKKNIVAMVHPGTRIVGVEPYVYVIEENFVLVKSFRYDKLLERAFLYYAT